MNKPQSYWEKRKARELYEELVKAEETAEEMRRLYMASSKEIQEEAVKLARRFQLRHNLTVKEAERLLARALDPDDIKNLIQMLKQDPGNAELAAELESQAYASRVNRLMAVQNSIDVVANEIYRRSNAATMAVLQDIGESMYYKQLFEMQQRAGAAFGFTPLDPDRVLSIINRRWSGQNFSERLWLNREQLAAEVKRQLLLGILTGRANRKMAQEIDGRFSVSYNNTRRLVRTEANYVANQLQVESYKDTGVDKYIYVAILDLRTSEICRDLDKKRFLVSSAVVGENYPPMHPWCRSTTIAWMSDQLLKKLQQSAIDPATGETITVPGDMTYREWYDKYVRDNPEALVQEKSYKNRAADAKQYETYKQVLGDSIPDNVYAFQEIKYNNPEEWERLKGLKRYLTKYPSSDSRYYDAMQQLKREGINRGVLLPPEPKQAYILPEGKRDPYHIMRRMLERNLTDDGIRGYMQNARGKFVQWGGRRQLFISDEGAALIAKSEEAWVYKTAWSKHDFDEETERIIEVLRNAGL